MEKINFNPRFNEQLIGTIIKIINFITDIKHRNQLGKSYKKKKKFFNEKRIEIRTNIAELSIKSCDVNVRINCDICLMLY